MSTSGGWFSMWYSLFPKIPKNSSYNFWNVILKSTLLYFGAYLHFTHLTREWKTNITFRGKVSFLLFYTFKFSSSDLYNKQSWKFLSNSGGRISCSLQDSRLILKVNMIAGGVRSGNSFSLNMVHWSHKKRKKAELSKESRYINVTLMSWQRTISGSIFGLECHESLYTKSGSKTKVGGRKTASTEGSEHQFMSYCGSLQVTSLLFPSHRTAGGNLTDSSLSTAPEAHTRRHPWS